MKTIAYFLFVLTWFVPFLAQADSLELKNGDEISGDIRIVENRTITLATDYAGDVLISATEVKTIKTAKPVHVEMANGSVHVGKIEGSPQGKLRIVTNRRAFYFTPNDIAFLRNLNADEPGFEKYERPMVWDHRGEIGAQVRTGNSSAQDIQVGYDSTMTNEHVELGNSLAAGFGWASGARTTQQILGESRLDWSHTKRFYSFYSFNGQHDLLKSLYLRAREEAGVGYRFIKTASTVLQADVGLGLNEDVFRNAADDFDPLGHVGALFTQKIGKGGAEFGLKSVFLPDFSDLGEFLNETELWIITPLTERFLLKFSALDRLDTNPPPAIKQNDITLRTGLVVIF